MGPRRCATARDLSKVGSFAVGRSRRTYRGMGHEGSATAGSSSGVGSSAVRGPLGTQEAFSAPRSATARYRSLHPGSALGDRSVPIAPWVARGRWTAHYRMGGWVVRGRRPLGTCRSTPDRCPLDCRPGAPHHQVLAHCSKERRPRDKGANRVEVILSFVSVPIRDLGLWVARLRTKLAVRQPGACCVRRW